MKKFTKNLIAAFLAFCMIVALPVCAFASVGTPVPDAEYTGWSDIPLLIIKINYKPDNGNVTLIKTTDDTYWYNIIFDQSNKKSLWTYYDTLSCGKFHFVPATENYVNPEHKNIANDGIVEVTINYDHSGDVNSTHSNDRSLAVSAATEFVDFKVFDKNGNGIIEKGELAVAFVCAGLEATRAGESAKPAVHAFQSNGSMNATDASGKSTALSCGFVKVGEMMSASSPLTMGSFAHELGHYIGTYDLYVNKSWGGANSPAGKVSVMAGSGSAGKTGSEPTGTSPSYLDAFHVVDQGWAIPEVMTDGEYTLYSRQSTKGSYQIYKIETLNPNEFYLLENRYFDGSSEHFDSDTNKAGTSGIIIWHVDYNAIRGSQSLTANNGSEIGVAALAPRAAGAGLNNPASSGVFGTAGQVFDCRDYLFPGSMLWTTSMTEGEGEHLQLKIEILDNAGHEMRIKVSGTTTKRAPVTVHNFGRTASSITLSGEVSELYGRTLESVKVLMSKKADMSDATEYAPELNATNGYVLAFEGLNEKTTYYFKVIYTTNEGEMPSNIMNVTTKAASVDLTHYTISFYRGLTSPDKAYNQKVEVGQPVTVKFPMKKDGCVFGGWYLDANFKQPFDLSLGKDDNEDIVLYARWIEEEFAVKVNLVGATRPDGSNVFYSIAGSSITAPTPAAQGSKVFAGWFSDEALTTPFDFEGEQTAGEITMYAKWEEAPAETSAPVETTEAPAETTAAVDTTTSGGTTEQEDGVSVGLIIGIVAIVVVAVVAVVVVLSKKKKA